jgi:hypothetical protein
MYLIQFNIVKMRAPFSDPLLADFRDQINTLHDIAKQHPGFVWRFPGEEIFEQGYIIPYWTDPLIMGNLSVWTDYASLYDYTFHGPHFKIMQSKRKWFEPILHPYNVMWWRDKDIFSKKLDNDQALAILEDGVRRLDRLAAEGPNPACFNFKHPFTIEEYHRWVLNGGFVKGLRSN